LKIKTDAKVSGCWDSVREFAISYLRTGDLRGVSDGVYRLLPRTEEASFRADGDARRNDFPNTEVLIDIAIEEKRTDDVVDLYKSYKNRNSWGYFQTDMRFKVASAVSATHPDMSLEIWRSAAEKLIAEVKPKSYQQAIPSLKSMRNVYQKQRRIDEWHKYIAELRIKHKAKRKLLELLDKM
jgi:uncharacterized Zn finger protein